MGRVAEVADIVTWLLTEPGADERRLDRIAAILAHSDTSRHAGVRAALDATQSAMADPTIDDSRSGRLCARLERLTADSPPTASDVAALRLLLDPTGSPERPPDLSAAASAPPESVVPVQPAPPAAETYPPQAEEDHAQWLASLAAAPASAPPPASAPLPVAPPPAAPLPAAPLPAAAPLPVAPLPAAGNAGWSQPYAGTTPTENSAPRHAHRSPDLTDGSSVPEAAGAPWSEGSVDVAPWSASVVDGSSVAGGAGVPWSEGSVDAAPWSAPVVDGSSASGAPGAPWPEGSVDAAPWSAPVPDTSAAPQTAGAAWQDSPADVTPTPAGTSDGRRPTDVPRAPDSQWAPDLAGASEAQPTTGAEWPADQGAAISTRVTAADSRWAPDAAGTPETPRTGQFEWPESLSDSALSMPAAGTDHARWAPDAAGPPPTPHAGNARWPENHRGVAPTPTTDPGDTRSPAAPFLPRDGLSRWPVNPTAPVPLSGPGPDAVNSRWPDDLAGRVAVPTKDNSGSPAWSDHLAGAFPPPEAEGAIAQGPLAEDAIDPDRPPGSAEREPWVR